MKQSEITGARILTARKAARLTQEQLAEKLSYKSASTISKLEKGENELSQSKLVEMASVLGVSYGYLMGDEAGSETTHNKNIVDILRNLQASINQAFDTAISEAMQSEETFTMEEERAYEKVRRIKNSRIEKESQKSEAV